MKNITYTEHVNTVIFALLHLHMILARLEFAQTKCVFKKIKLRHLNSTSLKKYLLTTMAKGAKIKQGKYFPVYSNYILVTPIFFENLLLKFYQYSQVTCNSFISYIMQYLENRQIYLTLQRLNLFFLQIKSMYLDYEF